MVPVPLVFAQAALAAAPVVAEEEFRLPDEALEQDEKTINVHVSHLREKLEDDPVDPTFILTIRGAGYAFAER